jgi:hypothetical protein
MTTLPYCGICATLAAGDHANHTRRPELLAYSPGEFGDGKTTASGLSGAQLRVQIHLFKALLSELELEASSTSRAAEG